MGTRSIRNRYINRQVEPVGYLSGLRILPRYRSGTLLSRGYRALRQLHQDDATSVYLTTIADGNDQAVQSLCQARAGLPNYFPLGSYHTFVVPLRRHRLPWRSATRARKRTTVRPLKEHELPLLIDFLRENGKLKMCFPEYTADDFFGRQATFKHLAPSDILTAWHHSQLVGCLGLWNQHGFKQTVVQGYGRAFRYARPVYNAAARLIGWPRFPKPGEAFHAVVAAFPLVARDDNHVLAQLLEAAGPWAAARHPDLDNLLIGSFERSPYYSLCRRWSLFRYVTRVYAVFWNDQIAQRERFRGHDLYLELGCL